MANPWLILGGLYVWDRLNRNSRAAQENTRRLAELEKAIQDRNQDEHPPAVAGEGDKPGGCLTALGCLASLVFLVGLVVFLGWLLFW